MREFLYNMLLDLDKLTGLKQYERLMAAKDGKKEINDLLDILCRTCDQFGYIPNADKERIISAMVISDQEFIGLNAKVLFKWFSNTKGLYLKELAHEETPLPADYKTLEGDERDKWLKTWQDSLKGFESEKAPTGGGTRLKASLEELPKGENRAPAPMEYLDQHHLHLQWMKECFDAKTGRPNDNWMHEEQWIELNS